MGEIAARKPGRPHAGATERCHVRVTNPDRHGFVEFQFSLGDPDIYLEMTLPPAAFAEFCARYRASQLSADEARAIDAEAGPWRCASDGEAR